MGLAAQLPAFNAAALTPIAVPTVVLGVRPGLAGPTGGGPVDDETFRSVLAAALSNPVAHHARWALTGYFATPGQVEIAAHSLTEWREATVGAKIAVDPIMGDFPKGLYVDAAVAEAIENALLPVADLVLPNAWETEYLTGAHIVTPGDAVEAAAALHCPAVISSVARADRVGAVYVDGDDAWFAHAPDVGAAVHGAGDHLAATFLASLNTANAPEDALAKAVATTYAGISAALAAGSKDIAITGANHDLAPIITERLTENPPPSHRVAP